MGTFVSVKRRLGIIDLKPAGLSLCHQSIKVIDEKGRMRLACSMELRLHTQMQLNCPNLEPGPAAFGQLSRLWNFNKAQHVDIKSARFFLTFRRDRNLNMVNRKN